MKQLESLEEIPLCHQGECYQQADPAKARRKKRLAELELEELTKKS